MAAILITLLIAGAFLEQGVEGYARLHTRSCDEQPSREQYPKIPHNSGGEAATLKDDQGRVEFQVKDAAGELVTKYNPGGQMAVYVTVPTLASAVVLVPTGQLLDSSGKQASDCQGRRLILGEGRFTGYLPNHATRRFVFLWTVPQDTSGDLTLSLGFSDNSNHAITEALLTLSEGEPSSPSSQVPALQVASPPALTWEDVELEVLSTMILFLYLACLVVGHRVLERAGIASCLNCWLYHLKNFQGAAMAKHVLPSFVTVGDMAVVLVTGAFLAVTFAGLTPSTSTVASRLGWVCTMSMTITMLPTGRRSLFAMLHKSSFDQIVHLHRWSGGFFMAFTLVHGLHAGCTEGWIRMIKMMDGFQVVGGYGYTVCVLSGVLSFFLFVIVTVLSISPVRRHCWEVFRYAHHLVLPAVLLAILHAPRGAWVVSVTLVAWLIDATWRLWGKDYRYHATLQLLADGVVRIHVPGKGLRFASQRVGQYVLLRFPAVQKLQWHPLTISSSPVEDSLDFIHKASGSWGQALVELALTGCEPGAEPVGEAKIKMPQDLDIQSTSKHAWEAGPVAEHMEIEEIAAPMVPSGVAQSWLGPGTPVLCNIDGPYGGMPSALLSKDVIILLAGGVGVTPMFSVAAYLCAWAEADSQHNQMPHVNFVWMAKGADPFRNWDPKLLHRMAALRIFSVYLYDTTAKVEQKLADVEDAVGDLPIYPGRCMLRDSFCLSKLAKEHFDPSRVVTKKGVGIYTCGPSSLCAAAGCLAASEGYMVHAETFEW